MPDAAAEPRLAVLSRSRADRRRLSLALKSLTQRLRLTVFWRVVSQGSRDSGFTPSIWDMEGPFFVKRWDRGEDRSCVVMGRTLRRKLCQLVALVPLFHRRDGSARGRARAGSGFGDAGQFDAVKHPFRRLGH